MLSAAPQQVRACKHCGRTSVSIHARGLCSLCYRDHRDEYPRTKVHQPYSAAERDYIRRNWHHLRPAAIAARLGRRLPDVHAAARRFGAVLGRPRLEQYRGRLVRLHARGLSDTEIAARLGVYHSTATRWLRRLGLPTNCPKCAPRPKRIVAKIKAARRRQDRERGNPMVLRYVPERAQAERLGWPGRSLFEARLLDYLYEHGPSTAPQAAAGIGRSTNYTGLVLRALKRLGLVAVAWREREADGWRARWCVYALAPGVARSQPKRQRGEGPVPSARPHGEGTPARQCRVSM